MLQFLVNFNLSLQGFLHLWSCYHATVHCFDGNFYATRPVYSQFYLAVSTLSQRSIFKFELVEGHIGEHLLILILSGNLQVTGLDEGC